MRLLYLSQYFHPETGATQVRAYEIARAFIRAGHEVTMLTEVPNHPSGIVHAAFRRKLWVRRRHDGIDVIHVWVKTNPVKSFWTRLLFYASFMLEAAAAGLFLVRGKYDLIFCASPPLLAGGAALALSVLRRTPMVFDVQDLWPHSAVVLGELRSPGAIRWATRLEEACYRRARRIVVTGREMAEHLVKRGIDGRKVSVVHNGANVDLFRFDAGARDRRRRELRLEGKFVLVYAGLLGVAQGLERVLDAAAALRSSAPDIHLLIVGEGPAKPALLRRAQELELSNVTFVPEQPMESIPGFLSAADACLVCVTARLIGLLPVKMFDAMACERPVVLMARGEAEGVIREANAGVVVPPDEPEALVEALIGLRDDPRRCEDLGRAGREAVVTRYSRTALADGLVRGIESIL